MEINKKNKLLYEEAFIGSGDHFDIGVLNWKPDIDEREIEEWSGDEEGHYIPATPLGYRDYAISRLEGIRNILTNGHTIDLTNDMFYHINRNDDMILKYDRIKTDKGDFVVTGDDEEKYFIVGINGDNTLVSYYVKYEKPSKTIDKLTEHLDSVSETLTDVEKAAIKYSAANPSEYKNGMYDTFDLNYAFEAGADWQKEKFNHQFGFLNLKDCTDAYDRWKSTQDNHPSAALAWVRACEWQKQQLLNSAWNEASLKQWYIANVDANPPVWTDEHIEELCKDFILVKKNK